MARHAGLKTGQHRTEFFEITGKIARLAQAKWGAIRVSWSHFPIAHGPPGIRASPRGHHVRTPSKRFAHDRYPPANFFLATGRANAFVGPCPLLVITLP